MLTDKERAELKRDFAAWLALEPFLQDLRLRNCSPRTIREYRKTLINYFLDTSNYSLEVSREELTGWVARMYDRGVQPRSVATRITTLRSFFGWAVRAGLAASSPAEVLPKVKLGRTLPKALTEDEVRRFMETVKVGPASRAERDLAVFTLLYTCGLRVSEAVSLRIEAIDLGGAILQVQGKGNKERTIDLREQDVAMLREQIGNRTEGWLFPGVRDQHLSARVVQQYCREYAKASGIKRRIHPHVFRHSCAVHYLTRGAPITYVQQRLGHSSLATTGGYTQLADAERARITRSIDLAI